MSIKSLIGHLLRFVGLTLLYFILFSAIGALVPMELMPMEAVDPSAIFTGILLASAAIVLVVMLLIANASWHWLKLIVGVWFVLFGVMSFMAQIETWYFAPALGIPRSLATSILLRDVLLTLVFAPLAVLVMGRLLRPADIAASQSESMPPRQWAVKLAAIEGAYLILYFGFGFIAAWQNPALRQMYGGGSNSLVFNNAILVPLQIFRSLLWVLFLLPAMRMLKARPVWGALIIGLLPAIPMNMGHAVPNPIMPNPSVQLSHFIETASSNFLFGLFIYWLLHRSHASVPGLFGRAPVQIHPGEAAVASS